MNMKKRFVLAVFMAGGSLLVTEAALACSKSKAPAEAKAMENPGEASDEVMAAAKKIYKKK